jgi:hypothetical protein
MNHAWSDPIYWIKPGLRSNEPQTCSCQKYQFISFDSIEKMLFCNRCLGTGVDVEYWDPRGLISPDTWRYACSSITRDSEVATMYVRYRLILHAQSPITEVTYCFSEHVLALPHSEEIIDRTLADVVRSMAENWSPEGKARFWSAYRHNTPTPITIPAPPGPKANAIVGDLVAAIPALAEFRTTCPEVGCTRYVLEGGARLTTVVPHLNDHHRWSREEIADWLETLDVDLAFT